MAKNSITDFDNTAANNTDIQSVNIDENCPASGINNAIRELMADLADVNDGTVALTSPVASAMSVTTTLTAGGIDINGNDLILDADGDSKIEASTDDTINIISGGTTGLTVNSDGYILTPTRPAFFAYLPSTQNLTNIGINPVDITQYLTSIDYNIGSCYSAANGFVAPVDGIYHFTCGFYYYNASDGEIRVYKNNSIWQRLSNSNIQTDANPFSANHSFAMNLSDTDAVKISFTSSDDATMYNGNRNTFFSGFLIG